MNDLRYAHIVSFCIEHPWAITRPMLQTIAGIISQRAAGFEVRAEDVAAAVASRKASSGAAPTGVALIPIAGVIVPRANLFSDISGGASAEGIAAQLRAAMSDPNVGSIVLDVDSVGGNVAGITELAAEIRRARAVKPVHAVANFTMASAAYWLAAQATRISASPSATVGSIGVLGIHEDLSKALELKGVKVSLLTAGKFKGEGNPTEPLSDEARAFMQQRIDDSYGQFVKDVALGRGVKPGEVRGGFGEGRALSAKDALDAGMVDDVATLDDVLARLGQHRTPPIEASRAAALQEPSGDVAYINAIERQLLDQDLARA